MKGIYIPARRIKKAMEGFEITDYDSFREQLRKNVEMWLEEEARAYSEMIND